jgi:WD40 repeat protein
VNGLAFDKLGRFASASSDGTVCFFSQAPRDSPVVLEGGAGEVRCVAFHPAGMLLAAGNRHGTVRIWDTETLKEVKTITGHRGDVWSIAFSPDGKTLAAVDTDWKRPSKIKLYDTSTWKERGALATPGEILSIAYSPTGDWLAAGCWDKTVRVFALKEPHTR